MTTPPTRCRQRREITIWVGPWSQQHVWWLYGFLYITTIWYRYCATIYSVTVTINDKFVTSLQWASCMVCNILYMTSCCLLRVACSQRHVCGCPRNDIRCVSNTWTATTTLACSSTAADINNHIDRHHRAYTQRVMVVMHTGALYSVDGQIYLRMFRFQPPYDGGM